VSARNTVCPVPEAVEFHYQPGDRFLVLFAVLHGKTFPVKVDLKWAGAGISHYSPEHGCFMLTRGRKGKLATEGDTYWDWARRRAGMFTATRPMAERLISVLWGKQITLDEWPADEAPLLVGAQLTEHAILFSLQGHTAFSVPRGITSLKLDGFDPNVPLPRMRLLTVTVQRKEGMFQHELRVDTESEEGKAALAALGAPGYMPKEEVQPFRVAAA
jgi:hypothetical protein